MFYQTLLVTEDAVLESPHMMYTTQSLYRKYAFGNYKELIKAISLDAGMLKYLNGEKNTKTAPDENYGREMQELFMVGKGPGSGYTEDDVKSAARVLTGWRINWEQNTQSLFDPWLHDTDPKQFSGFYNNTIITGQTGENGANELDQMLNMIFSTLIYVAK